MNIIDATTVSALLVVLALAVLAVVVTYGASRPTVSRPIVGAGPSYLAVPGRVVAIGH